MNLKHVGDSGNHAENLAGGMATTTDLRAARAPGVIQIQCPHCREPFETAVDTPSTEIVCSACGGRFNLARESDQSRTTPFPHSLAHFDLVERLGVGSFGTVWKAVDRKLDRTVAVKIPRQGMSSSEDVEKFLREARAAAQLQHPNIVRVHEVGRDGELVFIVSDFVRGIPLNDWLTGQQPLPTTRQVVELCAAIAAALQHAHDRGVIHRDLKPANILIDAEGRPHLMDFGLARREVGEVTLTLDGQVLGTPAYMSPEQARGDAHAADGRSDIYSLGVILFELLTGERPFRGNVRMTIHQVINEPAPSPRKLNGNVPKDVETIVLKCLEKEPARRYASALELSEELRRYLSGEPIRARPIGRVARTWRWAKRRPAAAALLALLGIVAAGSAAAFVRERALRREVVAQKTEVEARKSEAELERDNAEAVVDFLTEDVLAKASPRELQDKAVRDTIVKTLLLPAAESVGQQFDKKPQIEAAIRNTLALTLTALGRSDLALMHAEKALEQRRNALGEDHPDTIESLNSYAFVLTSLGRRQEAELLYEQALEQRRRVLGEDHLDTVQSLNNYAYVLSELGRAQEAEPLFKRALEQRRGALGDDHPDTIQSLNSYAAALNSLGRVKEAEPLFKLALDRHRKVQGEEHPSTIGALSSYAAVLVSLGRAQEAEPLFQQALEQRRKVLGDDHPDTIVSLNNRAFALDSLNRVQEAAPLFKQALDQHRKLQGEDHPDTIQALHNYAHTLHRLGRDQEAEPLYRQALEHCRKVLGEDHPHTISTLTSYATALQSLGRAQEAEPLKKEALEKCRKVLGENHAQTITVLNHYADVVWSLGRGQEAEPLYKQVLEKRQKVLGDDHPHTVQSRNTYAVVLASLGRVQEAEPLCKRALQQRRNVLGDDHRDTIQSLNLYADVLKRLGRIQEAAPLYEQLLKQQRKMLGENHAKTIHSMSKLASVCRLSGRFDEAEKVQHELSAQILSLPRKPSAWESYWAAAALLAAGKLDENRRVCRQLLQDFEDSGDKEFADRATYACVAAPVPESTGKRLVAAAEAVTDRSAGNERILGACLYRTGEYAKALVAFGQSHQKFEAKAWDHCFLAMLHAKLGNDNEAKKALAMARDAHKKKPEEEWYSNVETETLLAEATSLIEGKPSASID